MLSYERFTPLRRSRKYSTGAAYLSIVNNPRAIRFLSEETILFAALPGPHEPTTEQLNNILELLVQKILQLYKGTSSLYLQFVRLRDLAPKRYVYRSPDAHR